MLKTTAFCLLLALVFSLEVKVLSNDLHHDGSTQKEINALKLSINSNGKYVYPSQGQTSFSSFTLPQLPAGRHLIEVVSNYYVYPLLMIDTKSTGENSFHLVHPITRTIIERAGEPIVLKSIDRLQYLYEEAGFSIAGFLFSGTGMFLMFGVFVYLCYSNLMPKLEEAQLAPESVNPRQ